MARRVTRGKTSPGPTSSRPRDGTIRAYASPAVSPFALRQPVRLGEALEILLPPAGRETRRPHRRDVPRPLGLGEVRAADVLLDRDRRKARQRLRDHGPRLVRPADRREAARLLDV